MPVDAKKLWCSATKDYSPWDRGLTDLVVLSSVLETTCELFPLAHFSFGTDPAFSAYRVSSFLPINRQRRHDEAGNLCAL